MEDKRTSIDRLFAEGSRDFERDTPHDIWPDIRHALERKRRKKRGFYWRLGGAAAALIMAFSGGYYWSLFERTQPHAPAEVNDIPPPLTRQSGTTENMAVAPDTATRGKTESPKEVTPDKRGHLPASTHVPDVVASGDAVP